MEFLTDLYDIQVKEIWRDTKLQGWKDETDYDFKIMHRPSVGLIRYNTISSFGPMSPTLLSNEK